MPTADLPIHPDQALRIGSYQGVRLREDTVYTNHKGKEKKGIRKRTEKIIDKLQEVLRKVLEPVETVLYIARAQAPASLWEQLAFGWYVYYVTGTVLVFTNRRLWHFLVKRDNSWKRSLRTVHWGDLEEARVSGWLSPTLRLKCRTGKKEVYWALRRDDAKKIKTLLAALLPGSGGEGTAARAMSSLCPDCQAALTPGVYQCKQCGLAFKDERTLIRCSLLIPGGGYFYTGHWFLALGDFLVEAILLYWVVVWLLTGFGIIPVPAAQPGEPPLSMGAALVIAAIMALILAVEKYFTIHHCRRFIRDFIPTK